MGRGGDGLVGRGGGDGLVGGRWVRVKGLGPIYQQAGEGGGREKGDKKS